MITEYYQAVLAIAESAFTLVMSFAGHGELIDGAIIALAMGSAAITMSTLIVLPVLPVLVLVGAIITIAKR